MTNLPSNRSNPLPPMPESVTHRRGRLLPWFWPLLVAAVIFYASSRTLVAAPGGIAVNDKFAHFCSYGLLASLVLRALGGGGWRGAVGAVLIVSAYGASDEWHQSFVPGRSPEFADWVADTLGAIVAVALYTLVAPYRRLLETPLGRRKAA